MFEAVERILTARSVDMEARIRVLAGEWEAWARDLQTKGMIRQLRALLDAAPAGGAEEVSGYDFGQVRREAHERYEQEIGE